MRTIIAIPAYNEAKYIAPVIQEAKKYGQVWVIDDGSTDNTLELSYNLGAEVWYQTNGGAGKATRTAFDIALNKGVEALVLIDGDGQHRPNQIPILLAPVLTGKADVVIGNRFLIPDTNMSRYRKFGIDVVNWLFNLGYEKKIGDTQSGFRAFSKRAINTIQITDNGFGFSLEVLAQARKWELKIEEVPVSCIYHEDSHSMNSIVHGLKLLWAVAKYRIHTK